MNNDPQFSTGPRLVDGPKGDPSTQAIGALRGYAYQLYASALAWLRLAPGEGLYLEVAQDYAVAAQSSLNAVEVRDTSSSNITIRSSNVRDALDAFVGLFELNPERKVQLHYLTTSEIGLEREKQDQIAGQPSLHYWRSAARGSDVAPLRSVLAHLELTDRVRAFIDARDDQTLRDDMLRCIHWDCGQPALEGVVAQLGSALAGYESGRLGTHPSDSPILTAAVLQHLFQHAVRSSKEMLTDADLVALLNTATRVPVPRSILNQLLNKAALNPDVVGLSVAAARLTRVLEPEQSVPLPLIVADRPKLIAQLSELVISHGVAFISGSTGSGKTLLARFAARSIGGAWHLLDLRGASTDEVSRRLELALTMLPANAMGVILDDFNALEDPSLARDLSRFLSALKRRDASCIVTTYNPPSGRTTSQLGLEPSAHLLAPHLTQEEILTMVSAAGGDGPRWAHSIYLGSSFGHPQLAQAIISSVRSDDWPEEKRRSLLSLTPSPDAEAERLAVRKGLVSALSAPTSTLLYRISLLVGRFDRQMALHIGAIEPQVFQPGAQLDQLIGPWVESLGPDSLRMSPLLEGAGEKILSRSEQTAVHRTAAAALTFGQTIDLAKADYAFLHALLGKEDSVLMKLAYGILFASAQERDYIAEGFRGLRLHRLDRNIFPENPFVSVLLRLCQLLLRSAKNNLAEIQACWKLLHDELRALGETKDQRRLEFMVLSKTLMDTGMAGVIPDWIDQLLRFYELANADPRTRDLFSQDLSPKGIPRKLTPLGAMFILQMHHLQSVEQLKAAFDRLESLSPAQRSMLLADALAEPADLGLLVDHAWLAQRKLDSPEWVKCADLYLAMAQQARTWEYRDLASRCYVAHSIVLDEYLKTPDAALLALDEAARAIGEDPVFDRARAKILFRRQDHRQALDLLRTALAAPTLGRPIERAYMLREAGISAAEIGNWDEASKSFGSAAEAASLSQLPQMRVMAIGLTADSGLAAYRAGDTGAALKRLSTALDQLAPVDPGSSIFAGYCHRVVRHSIFWLFGRVTSQEAEVDGQPLLMLPGMCSNPEPSDMSNLPLASEHYARYLLAQTEVESGLDVGLDAGLREAIGCQAIPAMEISLRFARIGKAIRELSVERFLKNLTPWLDAKLYLDKNETEMRNQGPLNPGYGEIDPATPEMLHSRAAQFAIVDAIQSFGIAAAIRIDPAPLVALRAHYETTGLPRAGLDMLVAVTTGAGGVEENRLVIAERVFFASHNEDLTPEALFRTTVRFVQGVALSEFRRILSPLLQTWAQRHWTRVIESQRFYLRSPAATVPTIRMALEAADSGLRFVGKLVVAIEPAVSSSLDPSTRRFMLDL